MPVQFYVRIAQMDIRKPGEKSGLSQNPPTCHPEERSSATKGLEGRCEMLRARETAPSMTGLGSYKFLQNANARLLFF
jgi:hypothetical protein